MTFDWPSPLVEEPLQQQQQQQPQETPRRRLGNPLNAIRRFRRRRR